MIETAPAPLNSELLERFASEFQKAFLIRQTEELLLALFSKGKVNGTVHTCVGQEFAAVFAARHLRPGDWVLSNHRGHGHFIARTRDVAGLVAEVMGRVTGVCGGIGGSQHLFAENYASNGIQGGMTPIAAGIGLSLSLDRTEHICVVFAGDGTLGEGVLYEAFNLAAIWKIPVLFVFENNGYAQSTSSRQTVSGSVHSRANAFGLHFFQANTRDLGALDLAMQQAVEGCRKGRPTVVEIVTHRLNSHSKGDDNRNPVEVSEARDLDVLNRAERQYPDVVCRMKNANSALLEAALAEAEKAPLLTEYPNDPLVQEIPVGWLPLPVPAGLRVNDGIHEALKEYFEREPGALLIGEDIEWNNEFTPGEYGGAFKVTKDLSRRFPGRVRNTPISEAGIVGIGTGLALGGRKPLVEIMFGDFSTLILDQIFQHAAKFHRMSNRKVHVPLVVRTPMGGRRGYGPTHSQSIEKFFLGIPDLSVVALNHRIDPRLHYSAVFRQKNPVLVIENKVLYTRVTKPVSLAGFEASQSDEPFPTLRISPAGRRPDLTLACYGGVLEDAEKAVEVLFDEHEICCEIVCPSLISPLNALPILDSACRSQAVLVVEEGSGIGGFGSIVSGLLHHYRAGVRRFGQVSNNTIIPCSLPAELQLLPGQASITRAALRLLEN